MQVARSRRQMDKPKLTLSSVKESASCSHGWLRWTVQCIFGAITILSFVLIVYMAMSSTTNRQKENRCKSYGCRVVCYKVPYYGSYIQDLVITVRQVEFDCPHIIVVLEEPMFSDYTIPREMIANLKSNIHELEIVGGNMKLIAPHTFMTPSAASIERLYFESVSIIDWVPESLIGLTNLQEICIENIYIFNMNENALQAVDNTLTTLSITKSGYWNPTNLTGSSNLEVLSNVYFSNNNFNNILNRNSFARLHRCKVLYLDSCRINAIGRGTFDHLDNIEMLFLNNNFLVVLPSDIFSKIMTLNHPRPRVNLVNNYWYCKCDRNDLRNLSSSGILLVDPLCYYPENFRDLQFSLIAMKCDDETYRKNKYHTEFRPPNDVDAILTGRCGEKQVQDRPAIISPNNILGCSNGRYGLRYNENIRPPFNISNKIPKWRRIIKARFAMQSDHLSMIEITTDESPANGNFGLMWYQTDCPEELYCVSTFPNNLRIYNLDNNIEFTFCPIVLHTGEVVKDQCINHTFEPAEEMTVRRILQIILYVCTAIIGTVFGASILYTVIRKFPSLLKGSNRILFVKHKNVDALVLPPKVPIRESASMDPKNPTAEINNAIFILPDREVTRNAFVRMKSTRSNKSAAPSYISAMQPTEEQLTEWRLRHNFDNSLTITSMTSIGFDVPYSLLFDNESMYCSIGQASSDTNYESLKPDK